MKIEEAIQTLKDIYPSQKQIVTGEYPHVAESIDLAIEALRRDIPKQLAESKCPNGCGALEVAKANAHTNDGRTYFRVSVTYCPACLYIESADANL